MTVVAPPVARRSSARDAVSRFLAWHPEWWVYAVATVAWAVMVLTAFGVLGDAGSGAGGAGMQHAGHDHMAGMTMSADGGGFAASWWSATGHWSLMVAAMMLPVLAPAVRTVALRSLWSRRQRSALFFVVGYAAVWVVVGAALIGVLVALDAEPLGPRWLVVTLLVAAAWQVSSPRRRFLRRCGSLRLGRASGLPADANCTRVGIRSGGRCLVTCGPLMSAMLASHSLLLMAGLLVVMLSERSRGPDPVRRAGRPLEAWVIAAFATVVAGALLA